MSEFADDDLKRLKELDSTASIRDKYANEEIRVAFHALLARLELAEAVAEQCEINEHTLPTIEAWRKSKGELDERKRPRVSKRSPDGRKHGVRDPAGWVYCD